MKRGKEIFWGLLLILGAVFIIVNKMGYFQNIGVFTVIFTVFLAGILIENVLQRSFGGILFSLAFLGILYDKQLGIESLTPMPILLVALLGTIGLNMIFKKERHIKIERGHWEDAKEIVDVEEEEQIQCAVSFSSTTKYINSPHFRHAYLKSAFGSLSAYFDNAVIEGEKAVAEVDISFGNMELYIPRDWKVILDVDTSFGGVEEKGRYNSAEEGNTLLICGRVSFGELEIHYI